MKNTKRIITLTLAIVLVLAFTGIANAASINILCIASSISDFGGNMVRIESNTSCDVIADKIKHYMVLQRYSGGWQTYSTSTYYGYDRSFYSSITYKSVTSGYQYRLVTYHIVYDETTAVDFKTSISSIIYMD